MRDDLQGGLLATLIAAPLLVAVLAALTMRNIRRARRACELPDAGNETEKPAFHGTGTRKTDGRLLKLGVNGAGGLRHDH